MECSIQLSNTENGNPTIFLGTFLRSIFKQIEYKHEFSKTTNSNFVFVFVFLLECCFFLSYFSFPKVLFSPSKSICWRASFYFHKCHFMPTTDLIRKRPKKRFRFFTSAKQHGRPNAFFSLLFWPYWWLPISSLILFCPQSTFS